MKILLADDDAISRALLARLLGRWDYEVVLARDGREALELLTKDPAIQLCILDWIMPELTGPDVCRALRARGDEPYVYSILLTSKTGVDDVVEGLQAGADDFLVKPCRPAELEFRLRAGRRVVELQQHLIDARERLRIEASHDGLTGVLNRRAIMENLATEASRGERRRENVAVVMLDIDHFKQVNDGHGHQAGDEVLRQMPARLRAVLRDYDAVGRYGGEEFLVVLSGCNLSQAEIVAERIRLSVAGRAMAIPGGLLSVSTSVGVASNEQCPGAHPDLLIRAADAALYRSKRGGRNQVQSARAEDYEVPVSSRAGSAA